LNQLVEMAWEDKQPDVALDVARKQAKLAPRSAPVQHVLGLVHQRRGELADAESAYRRAAEQDPGFVPARIELARLYVGTGRADQALPELEKVLQANRKSADAWQISGMAHLAKGNVRQAQEAFKKALEANPRFAPAANNLAWLYSEHGGDAEEALRLAQLAKEVAPDDPLVSDTLGWVLYKRGIYQRALGLLRESAARLPGSAEVHYHLGMTHYKLGDRTAARQALSRALELSAGFRGAEEARKVLAEL
jgi:tetratricopeptide (TPR) repeat protein